MRRSGVEDVSSAKATGTEVELIAPGHTWVLILGKPSGAKSGYVRLANSPQSLLAAPLVTADAAPKSWLDNALIDLPAERVREIEERPADGAGFVAVRQKKEDAHFNIVPVPKGRELSSVGAADTLGAALSGLTLEDVAKAPARPIRKSPHAFFRTFDGLEVEAIGRKDGTRGADRSRAHAPAHPRRASRRSGSTRASAAGSSRSRTTSTPRSSPRSRIC